MIRDNNVALDSLSTRAERLRLIQQFYPAYSSEFSGVPAEIAAWAGTCAADFMDIQTAMAVAQGEAEDAGLSFSRSRAVLKQEYLVAKALAGDVFRTLGGHYRAFGFHLRYPRTASAEKLHVENVLRENALHSASGGAEVLPPLMVSRLSAALTALADAAEVRRSKGAMANYTRSVLSERWSLDERLLRSLYNWCVALWSNDDVRLNDLGFVRASQQGRPGRKKRRGGSPEG